MSAVEGSALTPISRTVRPLTVTRPSSISFSAARRDATPACDRIFWSRMPCESFTSLLFDHRRPEIHQLDRVHCSCVFVHAGVCDEPAQQDLRPHPFQPEVVREEHAL